MKHLTLSQRTMVDAYCNGSWENRAYLDTLTGDVVWILELTRKLLQEAYDDAKDEQLIGDYAENPDLQLAHKVEMDDERYLKIPEWKSVWIDRQWFADEVELAMRQLLYGAIELRNESLWQMRIGMDEATLLAWQQYFSELTADCIEKWATEYTINWI